MRTKAIMLTLALILLCAADASAFRFGVGGFAGLNFPVAQDDAKMGTVFGAKARVPLIPFVGLEPNFTYLKNGDAEVDIEDYNYGTMTIKAGKFTSFGADLVFGSIMGTAGLNVHGIIGVSSATYARNVDAIPDISNLTYWLGLGFEYGVNEQVSLEFRGKLMVFPYDDGGDTGSRKNGMVTAGINVYLGEGGGL
ncbi:MAG: outer membrane beta-barrel protein [bacterium]